MKIIRKELSLLPGETTTTYTLKHHDLEIVLKAFNNYKDTDKAGTRALFFPSEINSSPKIELFIMELLSEMGKGYRGKSITELNEIFYNFIKKNYSTHLVTILQHELQHAFEHDTMVNATKFLDDYTMNTSLDDKQEHSEDKKYANTDAEIYAKIVEMCAKVNIRWQGDLIQGVWLTKNGSEKKALETYFKIEKLMNDHPYFEDLTPRNRKRFLKGLYTTMKMLWDYYYEKAQLDTKANINEIDIRKFLDRQKL